MEKEELKQKIRIELEKTKHPEINFSLIKLGMIGEISIEGDSISIILKLPVLSVPIKEDLVNLIKDTVKKIDESDTVTVNEKEMTEKERERFMELAKEGWML